MRLTANEIEAIKAAARDAFGETTVVRLFGSRLHDHQKGGDVDLLIETAGAEPNYLARSQFLDLIETPTDGKKVDIVFIERGQPLHGFPWLAFEGAVAL
jgi:predicted nucleotidyltransferase